MPSGVSPLVDRDRFYKHGESSAGATRWQCRECGKTTNILPLRKQRTDYEQKRNEVLYRLVSNMVTGHSVRGNIEAIGIGNGTYYQKLERAYCRVLEFLEKNETEKLRDLDRDKLWINSDSLMYYLNGWSKRGSSMGRAVVKENPKTETHVLASADKKTRYVFRADVSYDWFATLDDIDVDTCKYRDDHLPQYARKYARLRDVQFRPQEPTEQDDETPEQYLTALAEFEKRRAYVDGMHTSPTYTALAHYWLLRQSLPNVREWRFITDKDSALMTAVARIFVNEIKAGRAHHYISLGRYSNTRAALGATYKQAVADLKLWAIENEVKFSEAKPFDAALGYLKETLAKQPIYNWVENAGSQYPVHANRPVLHPLARRDSGARVVDCITDLSGYSPEELAHRLLRVNTNATDSFFSLCRRRINILERPLTTARQSAKNYMYANINPKYAQQSLTILRTYLNFCKPFITFGQEGNIDRRTPAQRLGIADHRYTLQDILYYR